MFLLSSRTGASEGATFALEVLSRKRSEILSGLLDQDIPDASFYAFQKQTRKKFFTHYLDSLREAVRFGDTTDFLGNETFQSYSHARNGFLLRDVLKIPVAVKKSIHGVVSGMLDDEEIQPAAALGAMEIIDGILEEAESIRAQSFTQTRDEVIRFYHTYQQEIDRFPSNLAATLDFKTLMLSAVKKGLELLDAGRCLFLSRDLLTNILHVEAASFEHLRVLGDSEIRLDDPVVNRVIREGEPMVIEGYSRSMPLVTSLMKKMKTKSLLLVPLKVRERNVGVVLFDNAERPKMFTPEVVNLAVRYANRVATAMENARLHGSEQQKLKETMALLEVSRLVTSTLDMDLLLSRLVQITADVCEIGKCSFFLRLEEGGRFYPTATFGTLPDSDWETTMGEGIVARDLLDQEARTLLEERQVVISEPSMSPFIPDEKIEESGVRSIVLVPVYSRDNVMGIIVLYLIKEAEDIESDDLHLVTAVAGQAAVALENASLYENLEMSYFSTVKALARAIEVKDPYTFGHSERVTEYAMAIARKMGISEWERRNIKYAAALHDIGKIGIARKILNKPGPLSEEEFLQVKTHPELGDSIIEPVEFLQEPREVILHHHERYDGRGYPGGLRGEEIPLGSRILAVADSFEAMMSDRPYRKALPLTEAVKELEVNAGTQFDPVVIKAFVEVLEEGEIERHREEAENSLAGLRQKIPPDAVV